VYVLNRVRTKRFPLVVIIFPEHVPEEHDTSSRQKTENEVKIELDLQILSNGSKHGEQQWKTEKGVETQTCTNLVSIGNLLIICDLIQW
jgi:hypothetical protein